MPVNSTASQTLWSIPPLSFMENCPTPEADSTHSTTPTMAMKLHAGFAGRYAGDPPLEQTTSSCQSSSLQFEELTSAGDVSSSASHNHNVDSSRQFTGRQLPSTSLISDTGADSNVGNIEASAMFGMAASHSFDTGGVNVELVDSAADSLSSQDIIKKPRVDCEGE